MLSCVNSSTLSIALDFGSGGGGLIKVAMSTTKMSCRMCIVVFFRQDSSERMLGFFLVLLFFLSLTHARILLQVN